MTVSVIGSASYQEGVARCIAPLNSPLRPVVSILKGLFLAVLGVSFAMHSARAVDVAAHPAVDVHAATVSASAHGGRAIRANFERESASPEARGLADWVLDSGDNQRLPFVIVDKKNARVFVFRANGRLTGAAPALLGFAVGDDSVPGIGTRKLSNIRPEARTTPAGRFVANLGRNLEGGEILWVDYEGAVSLHPVIKGNSEEQRAQRLATPTPLDNRISYGCINVPIEFFHQIVRPAFMGTSGIVYVMPETRSAQAVFASYKVEERACLRSGEMNVMAVNGSASSGRDVVTERGLGTAACTDFGDRP